MPQSHSIRLPIIMLCLLVLLALLPGCGGRDEPSILPPETGSGEIPSGEVPGMPHEETTTVIPTEEYDPDLYVVIRTAEDLMAFGRAVNEDGFRFDGMTVVILEDVDMGDYVWTPLDGSRLAGVTFDGMGHTISNLRLADHEYPRDAEPANHEKGCGFVGVATEDLIFRNVTFAHTSVAAYDHSVGNFVGAVAGGRVSFEHCFSIGFTAEGWMDWFHRDRENGGHAIAMRLGGFVGYVGDEGRVSFSDCTVEDLSLTGFHNLAGFVGYDGSGQLDASDFTNCAVEGADITFSYCLAEGYTVHQPQKFVSVFYNSTDWQDSVTPCTRAGNTFSDVTYYDWSNDSTPYTPENFQSQSSEEANSHG